MQKMSLVTLLQYHCTCSNIALLRYLPLNLQLKSNLNINLDDFKIIFKEQKRDVPKAIKYKVATYLSSVTVHGAFLC